MKTWTGKTLNTTFRLSGV